MATGLGSVGYEPPLRFGVVVPLDHPVELLIDPPGPVAGFGQLGGLRERLADARAGVGDLGAGLLDAVEGFLLAGFEPVEPVLKPGDQPGRVRGPHVGCR